MSCRGISFFNLSHVGFSFNSLIGWTVLEGPPVLMEQVHCFLCLNGKCTWQNNSGWHLPFLQLHWYLLFQLWSSITQQTLWLPIQFPQFLSSWLFLSKFSTLRLSLLNFVLLILGLFSNLSRSFWVWMLSCKVLVTASSILSSTNFISVFPILWSQSLLMKTLNRNGLSTNSFEISLYTSS